MSTTIKILLFFLIILLIYMSSKYLYSKYLKYKAEYLSLKNEQFGGTINKELSNANNNLSVKLFNLMDTNKGNIFSPISITFALSLLHLGAQGNTDKQLTELFDHKYTLNEL